MKIIIEIIKDMFKFMGYVILVFIQLLMMIV